MKRKNHFLRREDGAELIEAALIYPFVLLILGALLYMGVFILQYVTVAAYAQKVALLAAREVALPGYIKMISQDTVETSAVEIALDDYSQKLTSDANSVNGPIIKIPLKAKMANARAYRYLRSDPLEPTLIERNMPDDENKYKAKDTLTEIMDRLINENSIMLGRQDAEITITGDNVIVAQYVTVDIRQDLMNNQLMTALGVENPYVHVTAMASANDTDEFIRNTDFVCDALQMIAKKLNIDTKKVYDKFEQVKEKLQLN